MSIFQRLIGSLRARLDRANVIDASSSISSDSWISGSTIRGDVKIAEGCKVYKAELEGKVALARYTSIWGPSTFVLGRKHGISIGSFCSIGRGVSIQEDNHDPQRTTTYFVERNLLNQLDNGESLYSRGSIRIGNDVWIGAAAQIQSGVCVGHGAIIAGGAIVTKDVPNYAVVAGNPARVVRYRFCEENIARLLEDAWWDWPLVRLRLEKDYLLKRHARPD